VVRKTSVPYYAVSYCRKKPSCPGLTNGGVKRKQGDTYKSFNCEVSKKYEKTLT
jgi:hypothetical protein